MIRRARNILYLKPRLRTPSIKERFHVVIVGGGFSGVALAAHLVRRGDSRLRITLVEESERIGRGVAYATRVEDHLLDTRAADMSVLEDEPGDFVSWLRRHGQHCSGPEFVSRRSYGDYVEDKVIETSLRATHQDIPFTAHACTQVTDVMHTENAFLVGLDGGRSIRCDAVVLATGHPPSRDVLATWLPDGHARWIRGLEQRLMRRGMLMPDPLGIGCVTGPNGAAVATDGLIHRLYVLGRPRRSECREGTAVPELRGQADKLAAELVEASAITDDMRRSARAHCPPAPVL